MTRTELTAYERLEIGLRYAVPILRDLQEILGEDVVRDALRTRLAKRVEAAQGGAPPVQALTELAAPLEAGFEMFGAGDVLDYEVIASDGARFDAAVWSCGYARLMASLAATDLGDLLICGENDVWAASAGVELTRTGTRMRGADHCDFRFRPRGAKIEDGAVGTAVSENPGEGTA